MMEFSIIFYRSKTLNTIFIIGYGDIGKRVAQRWTTEAATIYTLGRSKISDDPNHICANLDQPETLKQLQDVPTRQATVYYFAPPPAEGTDDPRLTHFLGALAAPPQHIIYISTSGVYGDCHGEWVDESRPVNPDTPRSQRRYAAEQALQHWCADHGTCLTILRVGGIYAAERLPLQRIAQGMTILKRNIAPYSNRIHADDLASACYAAAQKPQNYAVYNVSDGHPTTMSDYFIEVAKAAGLPMPVEVDWETAQQTLSPAMLSYLNESKRLDNRKMLEALEVTLAYPTLADGLKACEL